MKENELIKAFQRDLIERGVDEQQQQLYLVAVRELLQSSREEAVNLELMEAFLRKAAQGDSFGLEVYCNAFGFLSELIGLQAEVNSTEEGISHSFQRDRTDFLVANQDEWERTRSGTAPRIRNYQSAAVYVEMHHELDSLKVIWRGPYQASQMEKLESRCLQELRLSGSRAILFDLRKSTFSRAEAFNFPSHLLGLIYKMSLEVIIFVTRPRLLDNLEEGLVGLTIPAKVLLWGTPSWEDAVRWLKKRNGIA